MSAAEAMGRELLVMVDAGRRPPCADRRNRWTSEDKAERQWAARRCAPCPLLDLCGDLAAEIQPKCGVWGGLDWGPWGHRRAKAKAPA